uniref:Protein-tyrosine phosphatase containing protein n=1 Tax=Wuchereria bancrofti TaxID=6293 RepID=A0A1I8EEY4_WUCBA
MISSINYQCFFLGCILYDEICEEDEVCVQAQFGDSLENARKDKATNNKYVNGLFGECASTTENVALIVLNPVDYILKKVLSNQLKQLHENGYMLEDARAQCLIAYFKVVLMLQLRYDLNFCNVVNPENLWQMLQSIKMALTNDITDIQSVNSNKELLNNFIEQQQQRRQQQQQQQQQQLQRQQRRQQQQQMGDVKSDDEDNNENNFNSIPERYLFDDNDNFKSKAWEDTEEKSIDNDRNMLAIEAFMPSAVPNSGEEEEEESLNFVGYHAPVLKKDIEHIGNQNTGLEKIEHKIVKGKPSYQKVNGNRVYLKVAKDLSNDKLHHLINYLDLSIAKPNQLIFDDFLLDGDQLSFRAGRSTQRSSQNKKRLDSVGDKRRKDIQTVSGVHVDETGIGSGREAVPVESETRDHFFIPILAVSALTLILLVTVMAVHHIREHRKKIRKSDISEFECEKYNDKALLAYQDLCRYQMTSNESTGITGTHTNHSGTTTWVDEPIVQSNLDISTDDDTLVSIHSTINDSTFINASAIHDCDPKQANYIATQSPLPETITDFWQMIWEQAAVLIVNLANNEDQQEGQCLKYWPESGSQIYGSFEIHLVSEHIWSEDYLVRSFYLKNLKTNETRTVTQFHFLTWPKNGVPPSAKALLDFRRKINKSYRGRAAPIVVHCTDGTGRTGTFCLLDMILNRVTKGVKELNVAGSLEHLRDQRPCMVETCEQYKMVFVCLAEEITAIVAALS